MEMKNFIVIDDSLRAKRSGYDEYSHCMNGAVFVPLETPIPVIQKGKGCVGVGMVSKIIMTASSTTIIFTVEDTTESNAKAYYDLYRNQVSLSNEKDVYDNSDVVIPGVMGIGKKKRSNRDSDGDYRGRQSSISDGVMKW